MFKKPLFNMYRADVRFFTQPRAPHVFTYIIHYTLENEADFFSDMANDHSLDICSLRN